MSNGTAAKTLGNWLAPPRFLLFLSILAVLVPSLIAWMSPVQAFLLAFDIASLAFFLSILSLFRRAEAKHMRENSRSNDANRPLLLVISSILSIAVLSAIALELSNRSLLAGSDIALVIGSLAIAWVFGNLVYTLHYAHIFYIQSPVRKDMGGIAFPKTSEPNYWDFLYFAFTLGMTFQTSDVEIQDSAIRRVAIFHCVAAFIFNIGVLAFSINVLGS